LLVAPDTTPEVEFVRMIPEGVSVHFSRMWFPGAVNPENLRRLADEAEKASDLLAPLKPNVLCFCCTSGSFLGGVGYDAQIVKRLESRTGTRVTTTSTAVNNALQALNVKRIAIATPYTEEINKIAEKYFQDSGFEVTRIKGLGIVEDVDIGKLTPEAAYMLGKSVDNQRAECIFISCTNFRTAEIIEDLEQDIGKPVVSSNQATIWDALRKVGVRESVKGFGQLMTH
jgi:maleate isomerase